MAKKGKVNKIVNYFEQIQGEREQKLEETKVNSNFNLRFFNSDSFPAQNDTKTSSKKVRKTIKHPVKNSSRTISSYFETLKNCEGRPQSEKTKLEKATRENEKAVEAGLPPGPRKH